MRAAAVRASQLAGAGLIAAMMNVTVCQATADGWREDYGAITHFSGLSCPDSIGALERYEVGGTQGLVLASCTYRAGDLYSVIQIWHPGRLATGFKSLEDHYAEIGFQPIETEGATDKGLTFLLNPGAPHQVRETIWPVVVAARGLVVWMHYHYPEDETLVEKAYVDVVNTLRAMQ